VETSFFADDRDLDSRQKAALLASSFASWRSTKHPYPVYIPPALQGAAPLSMAEATRAIRENRNGDELRQYVWRCVRGDVNRCKDREQKSFAPMVNDAIPASDSIPPEHAAGSALDIDIDFDSERFVTDVKVWARFEGVSQQDADIIRLMAEPLNWSRAAPFFFKSSEPGDWDTATGKFVPTPVPADRRRVKAVAAPEDKRRPRPRIDRAHKLLEFVEWNWSPQVAGGIANVLDIEPWQLSHQDAVECVQEVLAQVKLSGDEDAAREDAATHATHYSYSLFRCLQSKFVSNWEPGGLDIDEGNYTAIWLPSNRVYIRATKSIRYTEQSRGVPGFSTLLNLMAPSVTSMLMRQLSFEGVRHYLETRVSERASSEKDKAS
jgi:hypothetical protein